MIKYYHMDCSKHFSRYLVMLHVLLFFIREPRSKVLDTLVTTKNGLNAFIAFRMSNHISAGRATFIEK